MWAEEAPERKLKGKERGRALREGGGPTGEASGWGSGVRIRASVCAGDGGIRAGGGGG